MPSAVEGCNSAQNQLTTTLEKLQIVEEALSAAFDQLKEYSGSEKMAEVAVKAWMKSNLQKYIQAISNQIRQSTEAYHLNEEDDMESWGKALFQRVQRICAKIAERIVTLRRDDFSKGEGSYLQQASDGN